MVDLPKTHPLYGAVEVLARTYGADTPLESKRPWIQEHFTRKAMGHIRALESAGYRVVGPEPTEAQWGGLARAIVMWCQMTAPHTPNTLLKHLERTGETVPDWLLAEPEMANRDHAMSKGTIAVIIWRAMRETAPTITETEE